MADRERARIRIPTGLRVRLAEEAEKRGVPPSDLVREALERFLGPSRSPRPTFIGAADVEGVDAREIKSWLRQRWSGKAGPSAETRSPGGR